MKSRFQYVTVENGDIKVLVDGVVTGRIIKHWAEGYRYHPKGFYTSKKNAGEAFATVAEVRHSLEAE